MCKAFTITELFITPRWGQIGNSLHKLFSSFETNRFWTKININAANTKTDKCDFNFYLGFDSLIKFTKKKK